MTKRVDDSSLLHYTPKAAELLPIHKIHCQETKCTAIFNNAGNYQLHLLRHHNVQPQPRISDKIQYYHCPEENCIYNIQTEAGLYFKDMRYVRQHYQKVHAKKTYICADCQKSCLTAQQLQKHQEKVCGKKFICPQCNWQYNTMEALLTHVKRKQHVLKVIDTSKVSIPRLKVFNVDNKIKAKMPMLDNAVRQQYTQTDALESAFSKTSETTTQTELEADFDVAAELDAIFHDMETQTDMELRKGNSMETLNAILCDIETQTDAKLKQQTNSMDTDFFEQILAPSTHMYTQTCDDLLNELDLTNIQTQTYWRDTSNTALDALVSTETQTDNKLLQQFATKKATMPIEYESFFNAATCNSDTRNNNISDQTFDPSYMSQWTQTCDDLLTELGFTNIQTQTCSSVMRNGTTSQALVTSTLSMNTVDLDVLVSTETQTSFTQCLLDAATCTNDINATANDISSENFDSLYMSQWTQTCESFLDSLMEDQDTDYIHNELQNTTTELQDDMFDAQELNF